MAAEQSLWKAWYSEIDFSLGTEHIEKIRKQNRETGLGLSHQNPGILDGLVMQAADRHRDTAKEWCEELGSKLQSSPKARRMRNKRINRGARGMTHFTKVLVPIKLANKVTFYEELSKKGTNLLQPDLQILNPRQHGRCLEMWPSMSYFHHFKTLRFCSVCFGNTDSYRTKLCAFLV